MGLSENGTLEKGAFGLGLTWWLHLLLPETRPGREKTFKCGKDIAQAKQAELWSPKQNHRIKMEKKFWV